jgi:Protein of unknown function (DUF3829)
MARFYFLIGSTSDRSVRINRSSHNSVGEADAARIRAVGDLVTAKHLIRHIRDHVPYSIGNRTMLSGGGSLMVEGSPPWLLRDYNQVVEAYNRGARI